MEVLLDTDVQLWMAADDPRPPARMRAAITVGTIEPVVSAAADGLRPLAITWAHAKAAWRLPRHHSDPFDRMLIAQARLEELILMTADPAFPAYDVALF